MNAQPVSRLKLAMAMALLGALGCGRPQTEAAVDPKAAPPPPKAFAFDPALFQLMPKPQPNDWLAAHGKDEQPQSFEDYVRSSPPRPTAARRAIVLQPLGEFSEQSAATLEKVREYCEIYFTLPTRTEKPRPLTDRDSRAARGFGTTGRQYHAGAIMTDTLLPNLPDDAVCYLGVTMEDLYPEPGWNFVFGQASLADRVGVYSFARFQPPESGAPEGAEAKKKLFLLRAIKVMVHEAGHMFGLPHCRKYLCVENGSNHLPESDAQPVFLCPECLRKLQWNIGFDVVARYEKEMRFWKANGFDEEAAWLKKRLDSLKGE